MRGAMPAGPTFACARVGQCHSCVSVLVVRACGRGPLPRTLGPGGHDERPSSESSLLVAASGGRAGAKRSRPERPALSKSAVGPARDCGPPGSGAPLEPQTHWVLCWGTL